MKINERFRCWKVLPGDGAGDQLDTLLLSLDGFGEVRRDDPDAVIEYTFSVCEWVAPGEWQVIRLGKDLSQAHAVYNQAFDRVRQRRLGARLAASAQPALASVVPSDQLSFLEQE